LEFDHATPSRMIFHQVTAFKPFEDQESVDPRGEKRGQSEDRNNEEHDPRCHDCPIKKAVPQAVDENGQAGRREHQVGEQQVARGTEIEHVVNIDGTHEDRGREREARAGCEDGVVNPQERKHCRAHHKEVEPVEPVFPFDKCGVRKVVIVRLNGRKIQQHQEPGLHEMKVQQRSLSLPPEAYKSVSAIHPHEESNIRPYPPKAVAIGESDEGVEPDSSEVEEGKLGGDLFPEITVDDGQVTHAEEQGGVLWLESGKADRAVSADVRKQLHEEQHKAGLQNKRLKAGTDKDALINRRHAEVSKPFRWSSGAWAMAETVLIVRIGAPISTEVACAVSPVRLESRQSNSRSVNWGSVGMITKTRLSLPTSLT